MDKNFSTIKNRVLHFIEEQGIVKEDFYRRTAIAPSNFKGKGGESELGGDKLVNILTSYPQIEPNWLMLGEGEMLKAGALRTVIVPGTGEAYNVRKLRSDGKKDVQLIPLYDVNATAGVTDLLSDTDRRHQVPIDYIKIPNMPRCDGALRITGDSMYPLLKSGDIVLFKELNDKSNIIWGEMYLAAVRHNGDEYFFSKYIQRSEREGYARFVSENRHHQPVEFPIDSIVAIALIKASIRFQSAF